MGDGGCLYDMLLWDVYLLCWFVLALGDTMIFTWRISYRDGGVLALEVFML